MDITLRVIIIQKFQGLAFLTPKLACYTFCLHQSAPSQNIKLTFYMLAKSAVFQLIDLYDTFAKAIDDGKEIRVIFCDISKAFDRVWHEGLLFKLRRMGITGSLLEWFSSYLDQRHQRVVLEGSFSDFKQINAGVPQGSILGPLLFLVFIDDIVNDIGSNVKLFADDTSLYLIVEDPVMTADLMDLDLDKIHQWANAWLVKFNPHKTEELIISRKNVHFSRFPLYC